MRISLWVENGGNRDRLWETLRNAERREGVVVSAHAVEGQFRSPMVAGDQAMLAIVRPKISKADRELARLRARLETLVQKREALKAEMDIIAWREKVTELAIQHADTIEQCGWDQRLCFGEEEVAEFGASVLESYEENHTQAEVDGTQEEAEWWCMGKKKCDRHSGCVYHLFMDDRVLTSLRVDLVGKSCALLMSSLTKRRRTKHYRS
jgi:COMPASS component SPP1